jgi:hypothetical protein
MPRVVDVGTIDEKGGVVLRLFYVLIPLLQKM